MKHLKIAVLAALTAAAAAAPLFAASRRCVGGLPPRVSGDVFAPVECSTTTKPVPFLPSGAVSPSKDAKTDLKDLDGRWEGTLTHALGRYELLLTVKTGWGGKAELNLDTKEQQFRERLTDRLSLRPLKAAGSFEAVMSTSLLPDASLDGTAQIGAAAAPETSTPTAKVPAERQIDLSFSNRAAHRIVFTLEGKDEIRLRAFSAVPGAPLQKFETTLTRTKRESL